MANWSYKFGNPTLLFRVKKVVSETPKSICVELETMENKTPLWVPRKLSTMYRYREGSKLVKEIQVPEWFAAKVGLLGRETK